MTVRRFTSGIALGLVALGVVASSVGARPSSPPTTRIVSVKATASSKNLAPYQLKQLPMALKQTGLNTVVAGLGLTFKVRIQNAGNAREARTAVKLMISAPRSNAPPTEKTETLDLIGPGQTKTVTFNHLGPVWFGRKTSLTVSLGTGQVKTYPVIFSLPG